MRCPVFQSRKIKANKQNSKPISVIHQNFHSNFNLFKKSFFHKSCLYKSLKLSFVKNPNIFWFFKIPLTLGNAKSTTRSYKGVITELFLLGYHFKQ